MIRLNFAACNSQFPFNYWVLSSNAVLNFKDNLRWNIHNMYYEFSAKKNNFILLRNRMYLAPPSYAMSLTCCAKSQLPWHNGWWIIINLVCLSSSYTAENSSRSPYRREEVRFRAAPRDWLGVCEIKANYRREDTVVVACWKKGWTRKLRMLSWTFYDFVWRYDLNRALSRAIFINTLELFVCWLIFFLVMSSAVNCDI